MTDDEAWAKALAQELADLCLRRVAEHDKGPRDALAAMLGASAGVAARVTKEGISPTQAARTFAECFQDLYLETWTRDRTGGEA